MSNLRAALCWIIAATFPLLAFGSGSDTAMLYAKGTTWINGAAVPGSSAIFSGDLVQTKPDSLAIINSSGANVVVLPDSLIKFGGTTVSIERGTVSVATSNGMNTHAGDVTVSPASKALTKFEVTDLDGTVQIIAREGDLSISNGSETTQLAQGQQTTRDDSQNDKKKKRSGGAPAAATGGILDSPSAIGVAAGAVGVAMIWVLKQGDEPLSPSAP
jgi:hypothetical protein